ncbi:hypothetical protein DFQ27_008016 [Actinomortierella ambigua]|uniref:Cardiolipin synthase N-terminal domain-containing protein n=1 Tax=Actinomortierella ambigua TaxID=1343610 RepID=A0A9P6PTA4_9FUNG|nr:hypothetical protein DFQ26_009106 [Actinomortierella ambigua]KAG0252524.1 hypothetical protein DFQ27_008016 [Actinomortierella ambigua]
MAPIAPTIDPSALYSGSLLSLVILILDLICIVEILQSSRPATNKLLWCLVIFLMPVVGIILYFLLADRERRRMRYVSIP